VARLGFLKLFENTSERFVLLLVLVRSVCLLLFFLIKSSQVRRVLSTQLFDACRSSKSVPVPHSFDSRQEEDWIAAHEGLDHQRSESAPLSLLTLFSPFFPLPSVDSLEDHLPRLECEEPDNGPRLLRSLVSQIVRWQPSPPISAYLEVSFSWASCPC
jgi:hypothetical protein